MQGRAGIPFAGLGAVLLALLPACASFSPGPQVQVAYSIPAVSYLRACPGLDCPAVAEIFLGDQVQVLETRPDGWWRVQSRRDEAQGWIQGTLLSERPLPGTTYHVRVRDLPLRDSPHPEGTFRRRLEFGERVQKLTEKEEWWRVLAEQDRAIGWVPKASLADRLPPEAEPPATASAPRPGPAPPAPPILHVASDAAALKALPLKTSRVLRRLKLNDRVESIAVSGPGWRKVRLVETGAEGWVETRFLRPDPVTARRQIVPAVKKQPGRKGEPPAKATPPRPIPPPPGPEPEAM